jgi:HAD superfamily hydrolase (TIGR01544 family)
LWIIFLLFFSMKLCSGSPQLLTSALIALTGNFIVLENGERGMSTYGVVESSEHLSANYKAKMQALFNTYYPIEVDPAIPKAEKVKKMEEWWGYANEAMVNEKASISLIPEAVAKASLDLRDGVHDLVETCEKQQIPLLIFSAGITDVIGSFASSCFLCRCSHCLLFMPA